MNQQNYNRKPGDLCPKCGNSSRYCAECLKRLSKLRFKPAPLAPRDIKELPLQTWEV